MENKFQQIIKDMRIERDLSQKKLAEEVGLNQATIAKWETGDRTPNMFCLIQLADYFDCSVDCLIGRKDY